MNPEPQPHRHLLRLAIVTLAVLGIALNLPAQSHERAYASPAASSDSAAVANTVDRFHRALASGDSATAMSLLAPDAVILESGGFETRAEYRSHHLPADIAFARAIPRERGPIQATIRGDVAWVTSTSVMQGEYRDRAINSAGAELMVLTRAPEGWEIAAIHWSSRAR